MNQELYIQCPHCKIENLFTLPDDEYLDLSPDSFVEMETTCGNGQCRNKFYICARIDFQVSSKPITIS